MTARERPPEVVLTVPAPVSGWSPPTVIPPGHAYHLSCPEGQRYHVRFNGVDVKMVVGKGPLPDAQRLEFRSAETTPVDVMVRHRER